MADLDLDLSSLFAPDATGSREFRIEKKWFPLRYGLNLFVWRGAVPMRALRSLVLMRRPAHAPLLPSLPHTLVLISFYAVVSVDVL